MIDGRLDDWLLELFHDVVDKAQPELSEATALRIGARYDDTSLYLGFKLRDGSHVQERSPLDAWMEDAVRIGLAIRPDKASWAARQKICIALSSKTGALPGALLGSRESGTSRGPLQQGDITWAITHAEDETHYELAIPWRTVDKNLTGPIPGGFLCFGVHLSDVDRGPTGELTNRTELDAPGGMSWADPDGFGMIELK